LDKLGKFTPKIGYPDRWRDYSSLRIDPADLMANVRAAHAFEFRRQLDKIGNPVDRDEWHMTPQTVNAYYNSGMNEIVFPAAILQDPFFNPDRDDAANYGAIGAFIGHEIGHGFDDQGSKYDGDGRLTDWWSATDRQAFETRTRSLIEQYDGLAPKQAPGQHVNGALTSCGSNLQLGSVSGSQQGLSKWPQAACTAGFRVSSHHCRKVVGVSIACCGVRATPRSRPLSLAIIMSSIP